MTTPFPYRRIVGIFVTLFVTGLLPPTLAAKVVTIADTGYQLEVPQSFAVHRPDGAPDILLQADRPDGNGTVQVVRANASANPAQIAADYEAKMQQALGNLTLQQENMRTVAGRSCTFRRYQSLSGGMQIRVQALFYADGQQGFVIHSIDTAAGAPEFERTVLSLQAPASVAATVAPPAPAIPSAPVGRQSIGQTSYSFVPPAGWLSQPASQNPGLQFALPDKGAVMELTWLDVTNEGIGDRAAFLDQTMTQVEQSFGAGWHERERSPHQSGSSQLLFKRFGGQLGQQPAELMILGATDGQDLVLAYGYFADLGANSAGPAMREAILSLKGGAAPTATPPPSMPKFPSAPIQLPSVRATPPAAPAPSTEPAAGYRAMVIDDAGLEFAYPAHFALAQRAEGQTQWADPNASGPKIVLVIQTIMRSAGQTVDSVRDDLVAQVNGSSAAQLLANGSTTVNGLTTHTLHFSLDRGGEPQHFRFAVLDLPGPNVATVSYTAPESLSAEAERHYQEVLRTAHSTTVTARPGTAAPATATTRSTATAQRPEPSTSQEAYFALAEAVNAADWDWVIAHMTDKALLNFCRQFRDTLPDADHTEADALDNPTGTLRDYLNYRVPKETLAGYFQSDRTINGVREENADWHLVMTTKASGGEHYLWFKRIKGIWRFDY